MSRTFRRIKVYYKLSDLEKLIKLSDVNKGDKDYINHLFKVASKVNRDSHKFKRPPSKKTNLKYKGGADAQFAGL